MTCKFDTSKIQDYLENLLSPEERQEVEAHLATCPECHREWVEMSNLMQLLSELPTEELPEGFKDELHQKLMDAVQDKPMDNKTARMILHFKKHFKAYSAAAAVLVIGMVAVGSLNLNKNGISPELFNLTAPSSTMQDSTAPQMKSMERDGAGIAPQAPDSAQTFGAGGGSAAVEAPAPVPSPAGGTIQERKVIRNGSANLSTLNYDKTVDALTAYANGMGGYVENLYTGNQYNPMAEETVLKNGSITIRIPVARFDDFFKTLATYGKVSEKRLSAEDISSQYRDTYNQAVNLEVREAKLREIMETAETVQDVMAVEAELSRVRGEINQLKGTLQQWDALVSLSRITINITEVRSLETQVSGLDTSLMTRIREAFIASVNSVIAGIENLAVWAVSAVPWLLIGGVLLMGLWFPMKKLGWIRRK